MIPYVAYYRHSLLGSASSKGGVQQRQYIDLAPNLSKQNNRRRVEQGARKEVDKVTNRQNK